MILRRRCKYGTEIVIYVYDTWGKLVSTTGTKATTIGADNPFRYRGYYYDEETGLYYLNQRYYNPEWGRFINADDYMGQTGELLSHNVFAYCGNNPVNMADPSGRFAIAATLVVISAANFWNPLGWAVVAVLAVVTLAAAINLANTYDPDANKRVNRKKQGRERQTRPKNWKDRSGNRRPPELKKHTPSNKHDYFLLPNSGAARKPRANTRSSIYGGAARKSLTNTWRFR